MNLTDEKILQTEELGLTNDERARRRCQRAKELQEAGRYEEARGAMGELWRKVGERPRLEGLGALASAEVLLRAGALAGFIGSSSQIEGSQEFAKNLISESATHFREAGEREREAEALRELGYCYWREGGYDEARVMLRESLSCLPAGCEEQSAQTLLRLAIVESSAARHNDALRILSEAAPLFASSPNHAKRGTFHMELAVVLATLAEDEQREDYSDRALIEYAAATHYFEQAEHARYLAAAENNFAFFLFKRKRYAEAHTHLDSARALFARLRDTVHTAQVDETRARVLLAEGRASEAEAAARRAARALDAGGELAIFAEALATQGTALARLGRTGEARAVLRRAAQVAEQAGYLEGAGAIELTTLEELSDSLSPAEMRELYDSADQLLTHAQQRETVARLRDCARRVIASSSRASADGVSASEIESVVAEACARVGKQVRFTPAAVGAMLRLPLGADADSLRALVTRTIERADDGTEIEAASVETVALRQRTEGADFADPWASFTFKDEVKRFEERLIEQALRDARGSVSRAARLLGFRHHESLNWRLKNRNKTLLPSRTPARKRRRSIIRKHD